MGQRSPGLEITPEQMDRFLADLEQRGRSAGTIEAYGRKLQQLWELLPEDHTIYPGTLEELRETMQDQGWSPSAINVFCAAANGLLAHCGRRDLQLADTLERQEDGAPELTRAEYLRLLSVARILNRERAYLLVKLLANTGINPRELPLVTVEAVRTGRLEIPGRGAVHISACLQGELLAYCSRSGVFRGHVFQTGQGKPIHRTGINGEISKLAKDARLQPEKCSPNSLRRLYLELEAQIRMELQPMADSRLDALFDAEQASIGWVDAG